MNPRSILPTIRRALENVGLSVMLLLVAAGTGVSTVTPAFADAIIDNGTVQLGINDAGHLIVGGGTLSMKDSSPGTFAGTTDVGLRYIPTNGEALGPGCHCEGWGVAGSFGAGEFLTTFAGYAQVHDGPGNTAVGAPGLTVQSSTGASGTGQSKTESVGTAFTSIVRTSNNLLEITHDFHPSSSSNLYEIDVTIHNISEPP